MLAEDVSEPRGLACITYNNECARELERRLATLGVGGERRVFVGTVHSFSLTQVVLPYADVAGLGLPKDFRVANTKQVRAAFETAFKATIGGPDDPHRVWRTPADRYRRTHLKRDVASWYGDDKQLAHLIEAYEAALRADGLIDFDDMPLLAVRLLRENEWVRKAIRAKYPILVVDEYQDLGHSLHAMVMGLCFSLGIRLFAVGDPDQSIYGFTGADPTLLRSLAARKDVTTVQLRFNYRCGKEIVRASKFVLNEDRDFETPENASAGAIYFHANAGSFEYQAERLFADVLPQIFKRDPDITLDRIAVLYPAAWIGNAVANAAEEYSVDFVRADSEALYPRGCKILQWLEACAEWCCSAAAPDGPTFGSLVADARRMFFEVLADERDQMELPRALMRFLRSHRDAHELLNPWLTGFIEDVLRDRLRGCRSLDDQAAILADLVDDTRTGEKAALMTLGQFAGYNSGKNQLNLSSLHSAKGREFKVVILFGMDQGRIPRGNSEGEIREARRLFYVGVTRAERELHVMHTWGRPSVFVTEIAERLKA